MKDRRHFIKTVAVGAGALTLTTKGYAQSVETLPAVINLLLDEPQFVTSAAASGGGLVTTFNVIEAAASAAPVSIGIAPQALG